MSGSVRRTTQPVRREHLIALAAPEPQHQVGQHDRYADRHQRLAQFLPLHAPKHLMLQQKAERADENEDDRKREEPVAGEVNHAIADVAAQKVERAMGEVDIAHQAEHQREAGRDQEIERTERNAGQDRVQEDPLAAHGLLEARRPRRNDQPCQTDDQHKDHEGPDRMAGAEVLQGAHAASSCHMLVRQSSRSGRTSRTRQSNDFTDLCTSGSKLMVHWGAGDSARRADRCWADDAIGATA